MSPSVKSSFNFSNKEKLSLKCKLNAKLLLLDCAFLANLPTVNKISDWVYVSFNITIYDIYSDLFWSKKLSSEFDTWNGIIY